MGLKIMQSDWSINWSDLDYKSKTRIFLETKLVMGTTDENLNLKLVLRNSNDNISQKKKQKKNIHFVPFPLNKGSASLCRF